MSKESFKVFARNNPSLIKYINNNTMTWQKFFDMYELYGENSSAWDEFLKPNNSTFDMADRASSNDLNTTEGAFREIISAVKGIDLNKVQRGIENIQKTISLVQDLGSKSTTGSNYERRPIYRRFED